jgi:hypothetical protein
LDETHENLINWNLKGLFDVYPIPPESQSVINRLCDIGKSIPLEDTTEKLNFLIYIEKVLELFQQMESLGIKLTTPQDSKIPLIFNTFQLSIQGIVRKDEKETYLISTGYWRQHNKIKPGIFKIFGPCSMINCSGNFTVSLGLQILSSSGQFYAAPMALDHTLRYPQDYEPHEPCFDRAGWLLVNIPPMLRASWRVIQEYQLKTTGLSTIIQDTIRKANDPTQRAFVPVTNIDGFWDA